MRSDNRSRRGFLKNSGRFLALTVTAMLIYPVLGFLGFKVPAKPRKIRVHKPLLAGGFLVEQEFVLFTDQDQAWAISRTCTHLGCRLNINENEGLLVCPCHQSRFDFQGRRLAGPAKDDLAVFTAEPFNGPEGQGFVVTL